MHELLPLLAAEGIHLVKPLFVSDAQRAFLEDYLRVLRWYNDPANRDAAVRVVAEFTKVPPQQFAGWVFGSQDYYRDPNAIVDVEALQKNVDVQRELGFLKEPLNVKSYVDMSLVEEAGKRAK